MGAKGVQVAKTRKDVNAFTKSLLKDVQALEYMLKNDWFECDEICIGAEQEVCLINENKKPAPISVPLLDALNISQFTTELAQFNVEANLSPVPFTGNCFRQFEDEMDSLLGKLVEIADDFDVNPVLTGILPTIRKSDLEIENLTPMDRYRALIEAITRSRGKEYELKIEGLDELNLKHTSALLEACNTSFQVHLQVKPDEFVSKYNIAQAIAGPVLAISTNSPMLFGKRLWYETRIALFQQSVDTRITGEHLRESSPRVAFGNTWLHDSILNLYKEDIIRHRPLLVTDVPDDVMKQVEEGKTPKLWALNVHNSTVYRWNRPCYGISNSGKPHLRIENRIFPAGPSIIDEVANAAFWIGLMNGFEDAYSDITKVMDFDDAKANFHKACRAGVEAKFVWTNNKKISDTDLIEKELLPIAENGLKKANVDSGDIDRYLGVIVERTKSAKTGSRWILESYSKLIKQTTKDEATTAIVASMHKNQVSKRPVHEWDLAILEDIDEWKPSSLLVEEFMSTDISSANKDDIPEFCADLMEWQQLRYMPVEDNKGELVGLITSHNLLDHFNDMYKSNTRKDNITLKDLMIREPYTVKPEDEIIAAMELMRKEKIGCLPVVSNKKLVGLITEENFINITASLLKRIQAKSSRLKIEKTERLKERKRKLVS